jgi:hypothetical protein
MLNHLIPVSGTNGAVSKQDEHTSCKYIPHWKDAIGVIRHSGLSNKKQFRPICVSVIYIKGKNKTLHLCLWFYFL